MNNNTHNSPEQKPGKKIAFIVFIALCLLGVAFCFFMMSKQASQPSDPGNNQGQTEQPSQPGDPEEPEGPDAPWSGYDEATNTMKSFTTGQLSSRLSLYTWPSLPGSARGYVHPFKATGNVIEVSDQNLLVIPFSCTVTNQTDGDAVTMEFRFHIQDPQIQVYFTTNTDNAERLSSGGTIYYRMAGAQKNTNPSMMLSGYFTVPAASVADINSSPIKASIAMSKGTNVTTETVDLFLIAQDGRYTIGE